MIDWDRVNDLRSEIGDDAFEEVVGLFLEETDEVIARLSEDLTTADLEAELHFLKGSSLNLGFSDLAALCQEGERRAALGDRGTDLSQVRAVYGQSRAMLAAGLPAADEVRVG